MNIFDSGPSGKDNKKRLELIKKHAAGSKSAHDLKSKEISEAIHGLAHKDPAARHELVEATKHYAAAIQKHLPSSVLKGELAALQSAKFHGRIKLFKLESTLHFTLEQRDSKEQLAHSIHVPEEAAVYVLLAKLSAFSRNGQRFFVKNSQTR